ncbi:MAG TPA: FIST N-terminal domain-containing protein [Thermoanaerobaculia bacterium]|nr:FIST N-terminal domain-containing protein [Thermoanaerobaculia bacterium]
MRSRTVHLPGGTNPRDQLIAAAEEAGRQPDFVLAFLAPEENLRDVLAAMTLACPDALRCGCEAVTQLAGAEPTRHGTIQLFWLADPQHHNVWVEVVPGTHGEPPPARRVETVARGIAAADGTLLLIDGLRFPAERFLADLRRSLGGLQVPLAGALASQCEPVTRAGARVFVGERVLPSACLVLTLHGFTMQVVVMRGWSPASPVYTVTRAEGATVWEIDREPATDWYRRFFTVGGELAPMPTSANRFPLLVEGPRPERQGLYRTLRAFDQPPGAVTFWGDLETGDRVRLGMSNEATLAGTAAGLAAGPPADAAFLYSYVERSLTIGEREARLELAALQEALGGPPLCGCFTFGEIGPTPRGDLACYNHTAVLALLRETGG